MYLAIKMITEVVLNPYYTNMMGNIEPPTITETNYYNEFIACDRTLATYLKDNDYLISRKTIRIYRVEEIFPRLEITTKLSFGPGVEIEVPRKYSPSHD